MRHDDVTRCCHMLDYAVSATRMVAGRTRADVDTDEMLRLALTRAIEVIGEAAAKVSQAARNDCPDIPWVQIVGTRNRLIHGYDAVDLDMLWYIVSDDLPPLIGELQKHLADAGI